MVLNFSTNCPEIVCYFFIFAVKGQITTSVEDNVSRKDGPWAGLIRMDGQYNII